MMIKGEIKMSKSNPIPTKNPIYFTLVEFLSLDGVRKFIQKHEKMNCYKTVSYSTYHDSLSCVDFNCLIVATNMKKKMPLTNEEIKRNPEEHKKPKKRYFCFKCNFEMEEKLNYQACANCCIGG